MQANERSPWAARPLLAGVMLAAVALVLVPDPSTATTFPGEDGEIAFSLRVGEESSIYVVGPDGSNLRRIQAGDDPSWSSDGQSIAYEHGERIHYAAAGDGHQRGTMESCFYDEDPAWGGPQDSRIAVAQRYGKIRRFALLEGDGTVQVLGSTAGHGTVEWAPDSSALLLTYEGQIREVTPDGQQIAIFGTFGDEVHRAAYSPDANQIVFDSAADGDSDIYVMDRDGSNVVQLTDEDSSEAEAAFSPDGDEVVLVSDRDGDADLYLVDNAGGELRQLTNEDGEESAPDWGRYPGESPPPVPIATAPPPPDCELEHERSVSLRLDGHLRAQGSVSTASSNCGSGTVVVKRRTATDRWRVLREVVGDRFDVALPDRPGRYRAVVRPSRWSTYESRYETVCLSARSIIRRHHH